MSLVHTLKGAPLLIPTLFSWNLTVNYFCWQMLSSSGPMTTWFSVNWPFSTLVVWQNDFGKLIFGKVTYFHTWCPPPHTHTHIYTILPMHFLAVLVSNIMSFPLQGRILWEGESYAIHLYVFPSPLTGPDMLVYIEAKSAQIHQRYTNSYMDREGSYLSVHSHWEKGRR